LFEILYERVAGLDVHKDSVTVTTRVPDPRRPGKRVEQTRRFSTFYVDLLAMARWLVEEMGIGHLAMEATGVYWVTVWQALREVGGEELHIDVVNAQHFKAVPGRKTDVKDSQWLARLMECGLLRGSFIPPANVRALRDFVRYRTRLVEDRTREKLRAVKMLELSGIKLDSVISDPFGVSGRAMLRALIAGERDSVQLAELSRGRMRSKIDDLRLAFNARFTDHHAAMLSLHVDRVESLDRALAQVEERIGKLVAGKPAPWRGRRNKTEPRQTGLSEETGPGEVEPAGPSGQVGPAPEPAVATGSLAPFAAQMALLMTIPGIGERTASIIISEIGVDMNRFPSAGHLCAWAGLAPGNNESAGKRRRAGRRKGNVHLASAMVESAAAVSKTDTRVGARFRNLFYRFGGKGKRRQNGSNPAWKKAAYATAHTQLKIVYAVLASGKPFQDLGSDYYDRPFDPDLTARRLATRLEGLTGMRVALTPRQHSDMEAESGQQAA
jgi:transposase